jgi:hypothetical protein
VQRAHASFIAKLRDESATITTAQTLTNKTLTNPVLSNPSYSGATANGGTVTTIDINGGTVDGTAIGGATPAAGAFTTLRATGVVAASMAPAATGKLQSLCGLTAYSDSGGLGLYCGNGASVVGTNGPSAGITAVLSSNWKTNMVFKVNTVDTDSAPVEVGRFDSSGSLLPAANGTQSFGSTSLRWSQVWCTAGAFNTSDARLKTPVTLLSDIEKQAAAQFSREIGTFQWLDAVALKGPANARHHVGFTVQRAQEILASFGLDPWRYGFMGYDAWGDEFVEHPATDAVAAWVEQTKVAGDAYAFRYDELNLFVAAGINHRLAALEAA